MIIDKKRKHEEDDERESSATSTSQVNSVNDRLRADKDSESNASTSTTSSSSGATTSSSDSDAGRETLKSQIKEFIGHSRQNSFKAGKSKSSDWIFGASGGEEFKAVGDRVTKRFKSAG
jgi:hypothetical protein